MDKSNVAVRRNGQPTIPPLPSERSSGATEPSTAETVAAPSRRFSFLTTLAWRSLGAVDETSDGSSPRTLKKKCHYNSAAAVASTTDSTSRSSSKSPPAYSNGPPGTDSAVAMSTPPVAEVLKFGPLHRDSTVVASVFRPKDEWLVLTTRELLRFRSLETLRSAFPQFSWLSDASNMSNYNANGGRATSSHPSSRRGSSGAGSTGGGPLASPVSRSSTWSSAFSSSTSYSHTPSVVQQPLVPAAKSVTADAAAPQPDLVVPLERILTVYKMEDGSPYFGAELWWLDGYGAAMNDGRATVLGSCNTQLLFATPAERGEWISRIRVAAWSALGASGRPRGGGTAPDTHDGHGDYVVPSRVRVRITRRFKELEPRYAGRHHVEIFPVVQRGLYEYRADQIEVRQKLLDGSTWYLALGRNLCYLAKVDRAVGPGGPDLLNVTFHVFGLLTLERLVGDLQPPERGDERFTLTFRIPFQQPKVLELASRYHRNIILSFMKADKWLKPAAPISHQADIFRVRGDLVPDHLPTRCSYGGLERTLEAYVVAYGCGPLEWDIQTLDGEGEEYSPMFRLLPRKGKGPYTRLQLLAVFRALRFNDFFRSLSFKDVDFCGLWSMDDPQFKGRGGNIISTARRGARISHDYHWVLRNSHILSRELHALAFSSQTIRRIDLTNVLTMLPRLLRSLGSWRSEDSEVVSPLLGLMRDRLTEADALVLSGNKLSRCEIEELVSFLASAEFRPHAKTLRELRIARCGLEDRDLARIWTSLGPQARTLRILDISGNDGRIDSALVATTLGRFTQLRILNLGGSLRNCTDVSLFGESPMPFAHLTDLDLSGCALGHATVFNIASYLYDLDRSRNLVRLGLANCNLTSHEIAMLFRCMRHPGRLLTADVSQNDVEVKLEELLDCIDSSQTPAGIRLDQIEFSSEQSYVALISALRNTTALRSLSLVGTCPPGGATPVVRSTLSRLLAENGSLTALDLSGQSGRLSDARLGPGLALALATGLSRTSGSTTTNGLTSNGTGTETDGTKSALRELRVRNQGLSGCAVELATALASAASSGLAVFDCSGNGLSLDGYRYLVMALEDEERASGGICSLVRFPITAADHHHAVVLAKRQLGIEEPATAVDCGSHAGISRSGPTTGDWHRRATRRGAGSVLSAPDKTAKRGSRVFGVTRRVLSKGGVGHGNNGCNWRDGGGIGIGLGIMSSRTSTDMKRTAAAAEAGGSASRTIDAAWADMVTRLQATLERNRQRQMAGSWPGAQEMLQLPELDGEYYDVYSPDGRLYDDEVQTYYCHSDDDSGSGGRRPWQADVGRPLPQSRMPRARDAGVDDGDDEPEAPYHVNEFITMVPFAAAPLS